MHMRGNTIFITGATSGIGRGLAEAFHERGNQVIVTGRREDRLLELCRRHSGMRYFVLDVTDAAAIEAVARQAIAAFPEINCVFNNAGVQSASDMLAEIHTNLLAPVRVAAAFIPHLTTRPAATLLNVSSGLAFVPIARFPIYCATKAAIHSWTLSLRHQLRDSSIQVMELIPPYVATELGGPDKPSTSFAMPLDAFIAETMRELETGAGEIPIGTARNLFAATCPDAVRAAFSRLNP
jgi:uncharacterized oxidoreductase